jgi:hypothetical protein
MKGLKEYLSHTARTKKLFKPMLPFGNNHITIEVGEHNVRKEIPRSSG